MACVPCHWLNFQCCYMHFGHGAVEGENAGLLPSCPSARPRSMARVLESSSPVHWCQTDVATSSGLASCFLPDAICRTTTHAADRHAARAPRWLAQIDWNVPETLSISRLWQWRLVMTVMMNTGSSMLLLKNVPNPSDNRNSETITTLGVRKSRKHLLFRWVYAAGFEGGGVGAVQSLYEEDV